MRKNTRIVSMAAAALLAVAPVAASAVPVNAAISLGTVTNTTGYYYSNNSKANR